MTRDLVVALGFGCLVASALWLRIWYGFVVRDRLYAATDERWRTTREIRERAGLSFWASAWIYPALTRLRDDGLVEVNTSTSDEDGPIARVRRK